MILSVSTQCDKDNQNDFTKDRASREQDYDVALKDECGAARMTLRCLQLKCDDLTEARLFLGINNLAKTLSNSQVGYKKMAGGGITVGQNCHH